MELKFDKSYWDSRWNNGETGWDIGHVSTPLKEYADQLEDKNLRLMIPGAGNAYEAEYLHNQGFTNVVVVDISQKALDKLKLRCPDFPEENLWCINFFEIENEKFDVVIEQTFFCALDPSERKRYRDKMHSLLKDGGKLVGLLFQVPLFTDHPPFGGKKDDYMPLFSEKFDVRVMETAYNSIKPRSGNELFINLTKK